MCLPLSLCDQVGFVFGLWLIASDNKCNFDLDDDDCDLDYEVDSMAHTLRYMFQVM